jgi:hypothetical protein
LSTTHVVDGSRRIGAYLTPLAPTETAEITVGSGQYHLNGLGKLEYFRISWGIRTLSEGPASLALNENLLANGSTGFRIDVASMPVGRTLSMTLRSGVNEGSITEDFLNVSFPATTSGYTKFVPFQSFPDVDFTNLDYISFGGTLTPTGFEIAIDAVATSRPGDFDGDEDVDGADFVAWQTNFPKASGAMPAQGDADFDGDVDGADFVVWQTHFPSTPTPAASPVPEPQAWLLGLLAVAGLSLAYSKSSASGSVRSITGLA